MLSFVGGALIVIAVLGLPALLLHNTGPLNGSAGQNGNLAVPTEPGVPGRAVGCDRPETTTTISPATDSAGEPSVSEDTEQECDGIGTTTTTMIASTTTVQRESDSSNDDADDQATVGVTEACFAPMTMRLEEWPAIEVWDRRVDDGFLSITYALSNEDGTTSSAALVLGKDGAEVPLLVELEAAGELSQSTVTVHGNDGYLNRYAEGLWSLHWSRSDGVNVALVLLQVPPTATADPEGFVLQLAGSVEETDEDEFTDLVTNFESYQTKPWPLPCAAPGA